MPAFARFAVLVLCTGGLAAADHPWTTPNLLGGDTSFETGLGRWMLRQDESAPAIDPTTGAEGGSSLRLAPGQQFLTTEVLPGLLPAGTPLVLSFYSRGTPGEVLSCTVIDGDWRWIATVDAPLSASWSRHHLRIPPAAKPRSAQLAFALRAHRNPIWLDAVQLEPGVDPSPWRPTSAIDLGIDSGHPGQVVPADLAAPLVLTVRIRDHRAESGPLTLAWRSRSAAGQCPVPAEGSSRMELLISEIRRPGHYPLSLTVLDSTGTSLASIESAVAVVPSPPSVAAEDAFFGISPLFIPGSALARIGARWLRATGPSWTQGTAPDPGSVRIGDIPPGSPLLMTTNLKHPPAWATNVDGLPADPTQALPFLRALAESGRERIRCLELQNEPDLELATHRHLDQTMVATEYASWLKAFHPVLRNLGIPLAMNVSGVGEGFAHTVFDHAPTNFDVYAIHPYSFPRYLGPNTLPVHGPEDDILANRLRGALALVAAHGGNQQVWIGELGWGIDRLLPLSGPAARQHAAFLVRSAVIAKSVSGIRRLIWFAALGATEADRFEYGLWTNRGDGPVPRPGVAAYAQAAIRLEGAVPLPAVADGSVKAYAFRRGNGISLALWDWRASADAPSRLLLPPGVASASTMTGEEIPRAADGSLDLPLGPEPVWLDARENDDLADAVRTALRRSRPVDVTAFPTDMRTLRVDIANQLAEPVSGGIAIGSGSASGFRLAPGTSTWTELDTGTDLLRGGEAIPVTITLEDGASSIVRIGIPPLLRCSRRNSGGDNVVLDRAEQVLPPDPSVGWRGPDDLSAHGSLAWDQAGLHLDLVVRDNHHHQPWDGADTWRGDSVQVGIRCGEALHEFALAMGNDGRTRLWRHLGHAGSAETRVTCRTETAPGGVRYRLDLPWGQLAPLAAEPGRVFSANVVVNDSDGAGRAFWIGLAPGLAEAKRPQDWPCFILDE